MRGAVRNINAEDRAVRRKYQCFAHGALVIEAQVAETALQYHNAFVLVGVVVPMWSYIGAWLHGVDQSMCREGIVRVKVGVFALAIGMGCRQAGLAQQGLIDQGGWRHGRLVVKFMAELCAK